MAALSANGSVTTVVSILMWAILDHLEDIVEEGEGTRDAGEDAISDIIRPRRDATLSET
jgi:hypothetical protein